MRIGGFQKFSLIDYPDLVSSVIFTQGCNFRCPFCHNPELVLPECFAERIESGFIFEFLKERKNKLQGITITGGEPTVQHDLLDFLAELRRFPFKIKLDTNGSRPQILEAAIKNTLLDYISMDIKAPLSAYRELTAVSVDPYALKQSIDLILTSGIEHQFRTTRVTELLTDTMLNEIQTWMSALGAHHVFQPFIAAHTLDPALSSGVDPGFS